MLFQMFSFSFEISNRVPVLYTIFQYSEASSRRIFLYQQKIWGKHVTSFFMLLLVSEFKCVCMWVCIRGYQVSLLVFAIFPWERFLVDFMPPGFTPSAEITAMCVYACQAWLLMRACTLNCAQYLHSFIFTLKGGLLWRKPGKERLQKGSPCKEE